MCNYLFIIIQSPDMGGSPRAIKPGKPVYWDWEPLQVVPAMAKRPQIVSLPLVVSWPTRPRDNLLEGVYICYSISHLSPFYLLILLNLSLSLLLNNDNK